MAQLSSINDIAEIMYSDQKAFVVAGNLYGSEVETPRNDAGIGLVMNYDASSGIRVVSPSESGLLIRGEVRSIASLTLASGNRALLFGINNSPLKLIGIR
jgi:hypothetical protein